MCFCPAAAHQLTTEDREELYRRTKQHKGRVCFSALDPCETARDKHFLDDQESLSLYTEMFCTAVTAT